MSSELVIPSKYLTLCPLLLLLPSIFPSIRVISKESGLCIRWRKYWSFSFSISFSNEYTGLISLRMNLLDLLAVQGTLKSLPQHHSSKASILWCSTIFVVQLSHPYMTTGKTTALTRWTFAGKVMSLLFNMLYRLVITFLPRSKCLLISWLQLLSALILEPKEIQSPTVSIVSPSICHEVMEPDAMISVLTFNFYIINWSIIWVILSCLWASLVAQSLKNLPTMQETQVQALGCEDPLEKEMATHFSILPWETPWTGEWQAIPQKSDMTEWPTLSCFCFSCILQS